MKLVILLKVKYFSSIEFENEFCKGNKLNSHRFDLIV
jgi:hypothetical protein